MSGGIMIFIKNSVGIRKMRIHTAKFCRAFIHQFCKGIHTSADMLRKSICHFIGGADKKSVKGLLYCDLFSALMPMLESVCQLMLFTASLE